VNPEQDNPTSALDRVALHALADRQGLAHRYQDFFGAQRDVPDETLRAALHAMGVPAADNVQVRSSMDAQEMATEQHSLPPVLVLKEGAPQHGVVLNPGTKEGSGWQLTLEDRSQHMLVSHVGSNGWPYVVLPEGLPSGYHRLEGPSEADGYCAVIVTPAQCWAPQALREGQRWWGPCVQLYALRSARNWGIGDFTDLRSLVHVMASQGAAFVGLNPLHALFAHRPDVASPYSPSSRNMLNAIYLDVEALADFAECSDARDLVDSEDFQRRLQSLRAEELVDYGKVAGLKNEILEKLWVHFRRVHIETQSARSLEFKQFVEQRGEGLAAHALFEALQAHFVAKDPAVWGWPAWPEEYRSPDDEAVASFAREHEDRVSFHAWLQWQAEQQLAAAQQRALELGMALGLYRDLAVGVNEGGSETWQEPGSFALGMHVGAPPDALNALGQNWGLPPINPARLMAGRYQAFIDTLQANMRHAGALRLDHVMGLMRLFWISPAGGSYVTYPLDDLLGILALESHRNECMVVGEDLGNVAPRMRESMQERGLLSYRPLFFERGADGIFQPPSQWPAQALAVVSTHDLPTLRGFWSGEDIDLQARLNLLPDETQHAQQVLARSNDRGQLLLALAREDLLPPGVSVHATSLPESTPDFVDAVYGFLARTPSWLVGVQLEDITQQLLQVNVPGTTEDVFPNWRRKLSVDIEDLATDPRFLSVVAVLRDRSAGAAAAVAPGPGELPSLETALVPQSTYRIQFHAGMTFEQAIAIVPYLHRLGISHLYASPYLRARAGSTHGYDIVDHNALNPEVGNGAAFDRLCRTLRRHGMHQMLDIVPNHMGVLETDNAWWLDVLENGPAAAHASTFDIEWEPAAQEMKGQVLLPVLGDHYGKVLEAGELQLFFEGEAGEFWLHYYEHRFPLDPRDTPRVFESMAMPIAQNEEQRDAQGAFESLLHAFASLPPRDALGDEERTRRWRDAPLHKRSLARLVRRNPWLDAWLLACLRSLNGDVADASSFDALDTLLSRQAYRLAYWRVAGDDINYRRFFDVNTLAGVRQENEEVFEATHRRILRWLQNDCISALRIDHPDGLSDPRGYFEKLQARYAALADAAGRPRKSLYMVVEKILDFGEPLPPEWPVHGGTGYRFANLVNGLFVDATQEAAFDTLYADFSGERQPFNAMVFEAKLLVIDNSLFSELGWLTEALYRITRADRRTRDFSRNRLRQSLRLVAASFPVYRTYIRTEDDAVGATDLAVIQRAFKTARRHIEGDELTVVEHLRTVLIEACDIADPDRRAQVMRFISRWQQFTAPVMAKALEDTAFYRYNRLVSLNDVGGDPRRFGVSVEAFHAVNLGDMATRPHWLLGTSTHDSKRSEDLRARLDVLSEIPELWKSAIARWSHLTADLRRDIDGQLAPSRNDEYLLWQIQVGVWPMASSAVDVDSDVLSELRERVQAYMQKAVREAKRESSWLDPNEAYEASVAAFIDGIFDQRHGALRKDMASFIGELVPFGCWNSLALVALKLTSPGVPDVYQGCEDWNFSLVDPDNRRPVDFGHLATMLEGIEELYASGMPELAHWAGLLEQLEDGRIKQLVTWRLLQLRRQHPEVFERSDYRPLMASGPRARHVVAFQRGEAAQGVLTITGRLLRSFSADHRLPSDAQWGDTRLVPGIAPSADSGSSANRASGWVNWFTGELLMLDAELSVRVADALARLPVAVFVPAAWFSPPARRSP
jgi:(1->4)-alpha-D-glucan 1-alpha-D-glucosylmutase